MNRSMFWAIFQSFCNQEVFVKLNLPIFAVMVGQREKSQKYCDPSARGGSRPKLKGGQLGDGAPKTQ